MQTKGEDQDQAMAQVTIHQLLTSVLGQSVEFVMDEVVLG
jgi:hypothetical protein